MPYLNTLSVNLWAAQGDVCHVWLDPPSGSPLGCAHVVIQIKDLLDPWGGNSAELNWRLRQGDMVWKASGMVCFQVRLEVPKLKTVNENYLLEETSTQLLLLFSRSDSARNIGVRLIKRMNYGALVSGIYKACFQFSTAL